MRFLHHIAATCLLILGLAGARAGAAPNFAVRVWDQRAGAPSDEVDGLCQDGSGYLWVITPAGLARFDGTHFTPVPFNGGRSGSGTGFNAAIHDPQGDGLLLAPHSGGLLRLEHNRFEREPLPANLVTAVATTLFAAPDGAVWIGFDQGTVIRRTATSIEQFDAKDGVPSDEPVQFACDGAGHVWLAARFWLARYDHGKLAPITAQPRHEVIRIASARQDGPWVIVDRHLMKVVDTQPREVATIDTKTAAIYLQSVIEAADGSLWLGSRSRGLSRVTPTGDQSTVLPGEDIASVIQDSWGSIWAGAKGGGLVRVRPGMLRRYDRMSGLTENYSLAVAQGGDGTMWFANHDGGVAYLTDADRLMTLGLPGRGWKHFSAVSLAPAPEGVWVTSSRGLVRVTHTEVSQRPPAPAATHNREWRITLAAKDGSLWAAIEPGKLGHWRERHWEVFGPDRGIGTFTVLALAEDPSGQIWVGGNNGQLERLGGDRFVPVPLPASLSPGAIQAIYFDAGGLCWLGTEHSGLVRVDGADAGAVTEDNGLPSDNISQVIADDAGLFWCGSHAGIFHIRRNELLRALAIGGSVEPVLIGRDEGLTEATCLSGSQPSVWKSRNGELWFATRQGVVAIDPQKERAVPSALTATVVSARADGHELSLQRGARVPPNTRLLELQYSVLCLTTPERVRPRYRLVGYDDDWTSGSADGIARFMRVPPGEYRLEVAADLAGQPGSSATASMAVTVEPNWSQTLLFKLSLVLTGVLVVGVSVRAWSHRRLRIRLARVERDSAIERERARIAQNIHDDLGAGLTRISLLTQSTRVDDGPALLEKIYRTVSELTQSLQEIVWAVNPHNDDLESLANYIAEYAQEFLTDAGIRCRVQLPSLFPEHAVSAQYRHELFLSCKEALNNVVKHARATEVVLKIAVAGDRLTLSIADNGGGMPAPAASRHARGGNGLPSLRRRMAALGGTCTLSPVTPSGLMVTLSLPIPATPLSLQ